MAEPQLTATIHSQISDIPAAEWDSLVPKKDNDFVSPFSRHAFLQALETSGCVSAETGWLPQHIVLNAGDEIVGAMPLYLKNHSQGEYVFDFSWADAYEQAGGNYYPKLQCSIPFTPASAPKILSKNNDQATRRNLLQVACQLAQHTNSSSVHATFLSEIEHEIAEDSGWLIRKDTQFHWHNHGYASFDDFLASLASRKRKTLRKERQAVRNQGIEFCWKRGADITEQDWDNFFAFYTDTGARKWGRPYLNREFFSLLTQTMPDDILLMFALRNDTPIAGTLNFVGASTLFGRYWGASEHVPFLHFELCYYQAIDFAIEHKLDLVEAGAQGEHKLARGYGPQITHSAHWIEHEGLRKAIADYLAQERRMVERGKEALDHHAPFKKNDESS